MLTASGSSPRIGEASISACPDTRELGQRGENLEHQSAIGGGGVDGLLQRPEPDVALLELADGLHEVRQRPAEPVEPPYHQRVPGRSEAIISASCGRSVLAPDTVSVQVRQQPAALRASCCNAASCWVVDTLAYPSSSPTGQHPVTTHRHGRWCVDDARGRCRASRGFFRLGDAHEPAHPAAPRLPTTARLGHRTQDRLTVRQVAAEAEGAHPSRKTRS